jgi:hypothetical protein
VVTLEDREPGVLDALALAATYVDELVVHTARDTHQAVATRVFGLVSRGTPHAARVPQAVHDEVAGGVYAAISGAWRSTATALAGVGALGVGPRLEDSGSGRAVLAAVNGVLGDRLQREHAHLALSTSVRIDGEAVPVDEAHLAAAFPRATERLVVFVHGLGEHEGHWDVRRSRGETYGTRLQAAGWSPVYLRLNTGRAVAENGAELALLMQRLVNCWPTDVRRIAMVGHSLGGLVIRAGCAVATQDPAPWTDRLSDVVTLGTPHLGADLALAVHHGSRLLALAPEMAGFGRVLDHRSPGIRDLERGLPELPPLPHVRYRLVSAALGAPRSPVGAVLGDLLVRRGSATATRRARSLFPQADVLDVPNADHFALLNHPDVCRAIESWLA